VQSGAKEKQREGDGAHRGTIAGGGTVAVAHGRGWAEPREVRMLHEPIGVDKETPVEDVRKAGLRIGSKSCRRRSRSIRQIPSAQFHVQPAVLQVTRTLQE
jgi:hypothetical protein